MKPQRRLSSVLCGIVAIPFVFFAATPIAHAQTASGRVTALAQAAEREGVVRWYEGSPEEDTEKVIAAFNKRYPKVKVRHVRSIGGVDMASRIIQESQANAATADTGTVGPDQVIDLQKRGMLDDVDWASYGLPVDMIPTPYALASNVAIWAFAYNTNLVSDDAAPKTWDDLLDPKWHGKIATLPAGFPFAQLAKVWGMEKWRSYTEKFAKQAPLLHRSGFTLAQGVGSGEFPLTVGVYHTLLPTLRAGAPMKIIIPDPTPINTQYSFVIKTSKSPNATRLFLVWLNSPEGALAYEDATSRGSGQLATKTAALLKDKSTAQWPVSDIEIYYKLLKDSGDMLRAGGSGAK